MSRCMSQISFYSRPSNDDDDDMIFSGYEGVHTECGEMVCKQTPLVTSQRSPLSHFSLPTLKINAWNATLRIPYRWSVQPHAAVKLNSFESVQDMTTGTPDLEQMSIRQVDRRDNNDFLCRDDGAEVPAPRYQQGRSPDFP